MKAQNDKLKQHFDYLRAQYASNERIISNFVIKNETLEMVIEELETIIKESEETHIVNNIPHSPC